VRKTPLFAMPFMHKMHQFYQDRLGTNIGKALKKEWRFFAGAHFDGNGDYITISGTDYETDGERTKHCIVKLCCAVKK
jgi:hypothetical protein